MRLEADALKLIAELRATLAGSSEGRGADTPSMPAGNPDSSRRAAGRPSLEPTGRDEWHEWYTAYMAEALRKQAQRTARYKRKLWREAEAAREERRRGKTYGPAAEGEDVFRGFREDR